MSKYIPNPVRSTDELNHSDSYLFHLYSTQPSVLSFCRELWDKYCASEFPEPTTGRPTKRKLSEQFINLALNLYVCWFFDETKCLGVPSNKNAYKSHRTKNESSREESVSSEKAINKAPGKPNKDVTVFIVFFVAITILLIVESSSK